MRRFYSVALVVALSATPVSARPHGPKPTPTPIPTPVPTAVPTPLSLDARVARLRLRVDEIAHAAPGRLGIAIVDMTSDTHVSVRGGEAFPLASVAKLAIGLTAYRRADQHRLDLDARVFLTRGDVRGGASEIVAAHPHGNVWVTNWELVRAMLAQSDNTASDVVLRAVAGPSAVQGVLERLGLRGFAVRKSEADLAADARAGRTFARGGDNAGTPDAVAALLDGMVTQRFLREDATYETIGILQDSSTGSGRLRAGFPAGVKFAHKTGTSETIAGTTDATNDAGVLTLPDGRRIVVVALLDASAADLATREATLAQVGRAAYEAFSP